MEEREGKEEGPSDPSKTANGRAPFRGGGKERKDFTRKKRGGKGALTEDVTRPPEGRKKGGEPRIGMRGKGRKGRRGKGCFLPIGNNIWIVLNVINRQVKKKKGRKRGSGWKEGT